MKVLALCLNVDLGIHCIMLQCAVYCKYLYIVNIFSFIGLLVLIWRATVTLKQQLMEETMVLPALVNDVSLVTFAGYLVHALKNNCEIGSLGHSVMEDSVHQPLCRRGSIQKIFFIALLVPICSFGIMPGSATPFFKICVSVDWQAFGLFMHIQWKQDMSPLKISKVKTLTTTSSSIIIFTLHTCARGSVVCRCRHKNRQIATSGLLSNS